MDSTLWKINGLSAAERGLKDLNLSLVNQAPAHLTFNADGQPFDSAPLFNYGDAISLHKGTTQWFQGMVVAGPRFGSPDAESHDYEVVGLWERLERLDFIQTWYAGAGSISTTHVILGRNLDNNEWGVGPAIQEVLDYAIATGAGIAYVQAELDALSAKPPIDEQPGLKCSEAILRLLKWYPDVSTWFDYAPDTPVLHFTRRASAEELQYDATAGAPTNQIDIRALDVNVRTGVIINYERYDEVDGVRIPQLAKDSYPVETVPGFDTSILTIALTGNQQITQSVKVITGAIGDHSSAGWWMEHIPELAAHTNITIGALSMSSGLPNILIDGAVPEWTGKSTEAGVFTAQISYTTADGSKVKDGEYSVSLMLTDADTHTFTREVSFTPGDSIPIGLAQVLYEALSQVHYQGDYILLEEECSAGPTPGMALNLTGGLAEWASMRAVIQRIDFDLDAGKTTISYGPPEHLGPQDHIALLNANRRRITLYSGDGRGDGEVDTAKIQSGGGSPNSSGSGSPAYEELVVANDTALIRLDPSQLERGKVLGSNPSGTESEMVQGLPSGTKGSMLFHNGEEEDPWTDLTIDPATGYRISAEGGVPTWAHPLYNLAIHADDDKQMLTSGGIGVDAAWEKIPPSLPDATAGHLLFNDGSESEPWVTLAPESDDYKLVGGMAPYWARQLANLGGTAGQLLISGGGGADATWLAPSGNGLLYWNGSSVEVIEDGGSGDFLLDNSPPEWGQGGVL